MGPRPVEHRRLPLKLLNNFRASSARLAGFCVARAHELAEEPAEESEAKPAAAEPKVVKALAAWTFDGSHMI